MMKSGIGVAALAMAGLLAGAPAWANAQQKDAAQGHSHAHDAEKTVARGYFEDAQVQARALSDWQGHWQSVYPYLKDGMLDPVMAQKAKNGDKTAQEYRAYYEIGYKTDVDRIQIDGDIVTFHRQSGAVAASYAGDGHEILTYEKGNRGVRFIFRKTGGDAAAPAFIQFSDHRIAPEKADHYHLYWGDDRAKLLEELSNWPTYYPADLDGAQILSEMMAH